MDKVRSAACSAPSPRCPDHTHQGRRGKGKHRGRRRRCAHASRSRAGERVVEEGVEHGERDGRLVARHHVPRLVRVRVRVRVRVSVKVRVRVRVMVMVMVRVRVRVRDRVRVRVRAGLAPNVPPTQRTLALALTLTARRSHGCWPPPFPWASSSTSVRQP